METSINYSENSVLPAFTIIISQIIYDVNKADGYVS